MKDLLDVDYENDGFIRNAAKSGLGLAIAR
jgi:hypothetical protein